MSAPQFTPGPWSVRDMPWATGAKHYIDAGRGVVATTLSRQSANPADKAQVLANARLIAAAPEMFAALDNIVSAFPNDAPALIEARAALAKARGEQ